MSLGYPAAARAAQSRAELALGPGEVPGGRTPFGRLAGQQSEFSQLGYKDARFQQGMMQNESGTARESWLLSSRPLRAANVPLEGGVRVTDRQAVEEFLNQQALAVVGVSRSGQKFGNTAYRDLKAKGYRLYPIHPQAETIEGDKCYASLADLPESVGGVLVVVPPARTEEVVRDAAAAGIRRVWMQQGAESKAAVQFCEDNGITYVAGECVLMFAQPMAFYHKLHRWVWGLLGKLPR